MPTVNNPAFIPRGFRVSRPAREHYRFADDFFLAAGNVSFSSMRQARLFAQQINDGRDLLRNPERTARAGHVHAMGLIDEIQRYVVHQYRLQRNPAAMEDALAWLDTQLGKETVDATLRQLLEAFPPEAISSQLLSPQQYLDGQEGDIPGRQFALEELLMLWLDNMNPAYSRYQDLFSDTLLADSAYAPIMRALYDFFATQPTFGPQQQQLIDMLRRPALKHPGSLRAQLEFLLTQWESFLGEYYMRLLTTLDIIKEEEKAVFPGPGPSLVYDYQFQLNEPEMFSRDLDWMPRLVMMAKNTYVWLEQLSRSYQRPITRLDQIPDEELDVLARRGFSGLWLIGLWERSLASQRIKQYCGNPEAVASAYSLMNYEVARDLGGPEALDSLRARAWQRGIRLASDMVPNHMGIDSNWVMEHPDWFVSLDHSPFPAYSFNGGDLSWDERIGIYLEDHYYSRSDAAVVFKRHDRWTGETRYIYHGNDGTSMPWNDTAQLNYLLPQVREAVIQTILHVARQFPIIRFDAAMTLAKKHYQRLWFPEPGSGGAIPSRAEHGMPAADFHAVFPQEFWREVVDRVAQEVPDTLLLAEAFWLMEGYFVRTLGMHRVYNSAFMNMLRDEENANYRSVLKNTMEFDPDILKRFVNFMNNPDERTAIDQFGKGDKYFGICTMMCTLPGLPMFGHGQIEGFAEKYGMEYRRPYWDEQPDIELVARHEREIVPLLHRRHLFAEAEYFRLYDFYTVDGYVCEDVMAYSNRAGYERGLIIYHNKYASVHGWIRTSAARLVKGEHEQHGTLQQTSLGENLRLGNEAGLFVLFRDYTTNLEYIRPSCDLHQRGLYVELHAYQYHIFLDFREVHDTAAGEFAQVCAQLQGHGVESIDDMVRERALLPILQPFRQLMDATLLQRLIDARAQSPGDIPDASVLSETTLRLQALLAVLHERAGETGAPATAVAARAGALLETLLRLPVRLHEHREISDTETTILLYDGDKELWSSLLVWAMTLYLGQASDDTAWAEESRDYFDALMFGKNITAALRELGLAGEEAARVVTLSQALIGDFAAIAVDDTPSALLARWLQDDAARRVLGVHEFDGLLWFEQQGLHLMTRASGLIRLVRLLLEVGETAIASSALQALTQQRAQFDRAEAASGYLVEPLLHALQHIVIEEGDPIADKTIPPA